MKNLFLALSVLITACQSAAPSAPVSTPITAIDFYGVHLDILPDAEQITSLPDSANNQIYVGESYRFDFVSAHNYLAGRYFYNLTIGEEVQIFYSDNTSSTYIVKSIDIVKDDDAGIFIAQHYGENSIVFYTCYPLSEPITTTGLYVTLIPYAKLK